MLVAQHESARLSALFIIWLIFFVGQLVIELLMLSIMFGMYKMTWKRLKGNEQVAKTRIKVGEWEELAI